jgi:hypothetical protein
MVGFLGTFLYIIRDMYRAVKNADFAPVCGLYDAA